MPPHQLRDDIPGKVIQAAAENPRHDHQTIQRHGMCQCLDLVGDLRRRTCHMIGSVRLRRPCRVVRRTDGHDLGKQPQILRITTGAPRRSKHVVAQATALPVVAVPRMAMSACRPAKSADRLSTTR